MPTRIYWDNPEQTIIIREMSDPWTWVDYGNAIAEVTNLLHQVDHIVDIIVDCHQTHSLPHGALQNIANSNKAYPNNMGQQVIVTRSHLIEIFAKMLQDHLPDKKHLFTFVNTMEDAYHHIQTSKTRA